MEKIGSTSWLVAEPKEQKGEGGVVEQSPPKPKCSPIFTSASKVKMAILL